MLYSVTRSWCRWICKSLCRRASNVNGVNYNSGRSSVSSTIGVWSISFQISSWLLDAWSWWSLEKRLCSLPIFLSALGPSLLGLLFPATFTKQLTTVWSQERLLLQFLLFSELWSVWHLSSLVLDSWVSVSSGTHIDSRTSQCRSSLASQQWTAIHF